MTREEQISEAAGVYECDKQHSERKFNEDGYKYRDFVAGAHWADANPDGISSATVIREVIKGLEGKLTVAVEAIKIADKLIGSDVRQWDQEDADMSARFTELCKQLKAE